MNKEINEQSVGRLRFLIKKTKNKEALEILANVGVNIMIHDLGTPLHVACIFNNEKIADYCLENGANVNVTDASTDTPLITCCKTGNYGLVKKLVSKGADINAKNKYDRTPIARAISDHPDNLELIEFLLKNGADPTIHESYAEEDERITTRNAYEYAKQEINNPELNSLLEKYIKK